MRAGLGSTNYFPDFAYFPHGGELTKSPRGAIMALLQGVVKFHTGGDAAFGRRVRERRSKRR